MTVAYIVNDLRELVEMPTISGLRTGFGSFCSALVAFYNRGFFVLQFPILQGRLRSFFCLTQRRTNGKVLESDQSKKWSVDGRLTTKAASKLAKIKPLNHEGHKGTQSELLNPAPNED